MALSALSLPAVLHPWLQLAGFALAGRVLLAWLPPGRPGSHAPRGLACTWAASHLIGVTWTILWQRAADFGAIDEGTAVWVAWTAIGVLLVARLATLPARLVPRHELEPARAGPAVRALHVLALATAVVLPALLGEGWPTPWSGATAVAAVVLVVEGLELARAPAWAGAAAAVLLATAIGSLVHLGGGAGSFVAAWSVLTGAAAGAGAIGWIRRADTRCLALAALAGGGAALLGPLQALLPAGFALWLVLAAPRPVRLRVLTWTVGALAPALGALALEPAAWLGAPAFTARAATTGPLLLALLGLGIAAGAVASARRPPPSWNPSGAPRGLEERVLLRAVVTALVLGWLAQRAEVTQGLPLLPCLGVLAILFGMGLAHLAPARAEPG